MFTSTETQDTSSEGNSSIEFPMRLIFVTSLDFHISDGTPLKLSPAKESSWKSNNVVDPKIHLQSKDANIRMKKELQRKVLLLIQLGIRITGLDGPAVH